MKVFYVTSTEFYKKHPDKYNAMLKLLEKLTGKKPNHYTDQQSQEFDFTKDQDELTGMIRKMERALKDSDVLIADISISSAGPGYDIATALNLKKPVLVLKREDDKAKRGPHSITVKKTRLMNFIKYNEKNIEKIIKDFLQNAKQKLDTKFILIISPEIDRYLEWASDYKRMHKAQIVRDAVGERMKKDQEWKELQEE